MEEVNARIKQWAAKIRAQVKMHTDWPKLIHALRHTAQNDLQRSFTETEIANALDHVFDSYDPNALAPPEDFESEHWLDNPFWSLTEIDNEANLLAVFIADSDDVNTFHHYLLRDQKKDLQNQRLDLAWKHLKIQTPSLQLLPRLIFFAYLQNELNISKQAHKILSQLESFTDIEKLYKKFNYSNTKFILGLKTSTNIPIEEILDLCFIDHGKIFANTLFEIVRSEILDVRKISSFTEIEFLEIDWSTMDDRAFSNFGMLNNIRDLNVYTYTRHTFPDKKINSVSLKKLEVNGRLAALTPDIGLFTGLEKIKLSQLKIATLPAEIFHLLNLISLDANNNLFEKLPEVTTSKLHLQTLDLRFNSISHIPDSWSCLKNLRELLLSNNNLGEIPGFIQKLNKLEKLDLGNNQIKTLPSWISTLRGLRELYCSTNSIVSVPDEVLSMNHLKLLDLRFNPIAESYANKLRTQLPETTVLV